MFKEFFIYKIVKESSIIKSFYFKRLDNGPLDNYFPGQHALIRININGSDKKIIRNYTISDSPNKDYYRFTIKREEHGVVSQYFHDVLKVGDKIDISKPNGDFYLSAGSNNPVVLISGGVGITPMLSMVEYMLTQTPSRKIFFLHASQNKSVQAMLDSLKELDENNKNFYLSIHHSNPESDELLNIDYTHNGYITKSYLEATLPKTDLDYYLCGPLPFMEIVFQSLTEIGVNPKNISYEFFGGAKKLGELPALTDSNSSKFKVKFKKSDKVIIWEDTQASILDLAESAGLSPEFNCRMGTCSTCESTLLKGNVEYDPEPFMEIPEGRVLICCSKPTSDIEIEL